MTLDFVIGHLSPAPWPGCQGGAVLVITMDAILPLKDKHIVLGICGGIAAFQIADLASKLTQAGAKVDCVLTESAAKFVAPLTFATVTGRPALTDADLWRHDLHVPHVTLGESANLLIIVPATANTIAKLAHGQADNLLTVTALAARCPIVIVPAMDGAMWSNAATQANVETLRARRGARHSHSAMAANTPKKNPSRTAGSCRRSSLIKRKYSRVRLNIILFARMLSMPSFKKQLFEQFARVGRALGSGHRMEILELLAQGERSVEALAALTGLSVANTSQHLQQLRRVGLVATRKEGLRVHYRLADPAVSELLGAMQRIAERQFAEVGRIVRSYLSAKDDLEPVSRAELLERAARCDVTIVDVRPPEEFAAGPLPGARNVPLGELEARRGKLPRGREVVAYCRGPYCLMSYEAVELLRRKGHKARRLENGLPEWRLAGLPVEQG